MQIQVRGYLTYRELLGTRQVEVSIQPATLRDCLHVLEEAQSSELQPHVALLLNGQHYRHLSEGLDTIVHEGDQLAFFPPIAGG